MWRRTERANLEKKPSMRLSQEPCLGVNVNSKACRSGIEPGTGFFRDVCGVIVEDQLDRRAGRIGGVEKLEEFDELAAAVTSQALASGVITGSLPGRGRSSSAASAP